MSKNNEELDRHRATIAAKKTTQKKQKRQIVEELENDEDISGLLSDRDLRKLYE